MIILYFRLGSTANMNCKYIRFYDLGEFIRGSAMENEQNWGRPGNELQNLLLEFCLK